MRKIRVAFFADMLLEDFDGCIRTIQQIVRRIPKDEFEFLFLTGWPPKNEGDHKYVKLSTVPMPFNAPYRATVPLFSSRTLKKELRAFKPDLIHVSNPSMLGNYAAKYAKANSLPLTTIYHTHYVTYVKYYFRFIKPLIPLGEAKIVAMTKALYDKCDIVYVPVKGIIDDFKALNMKTSNCSIWPRGIDSKLFNPEKRDVSYLRTLTGNDEPNILFASRLVWEKNLETLIQIYDLSRKRGFTFNLIIAGEGASTAGLKERLPDALYLGELSHEELSKVYASSDLFLFPSDTETYGNVVTEAMASGIPTIAANKGGPTGIIEDGVSGFLTESHEPEGYLEKIKLLLSDRELYEKIRSEGLEYTKSLSWKYLTDRYFSDLRRLYQESQDS